MKKSIATIGMFDGVHLGHQKILKTLVAFASKNKAKSVVVTFDNVPKKHSGMLLTLDQRVQLIKTFGVKEVKVLSFEKIKDLSASDFFNLYLKNYFGIVIGHDFRFGKNRSDGEQIIKKLCPKVVVVEPIKYSDKIISSTQIKNELFDGCLKNINNLLGRNYTFDGIVVHGHKIGAKLGFPTANLKVYKEKILPEGVFVSIAKIGSKKYNSMTYIGKRPTFGSYSKMVEVYILGFCGLLYGKKIEVELLSKIRSEKKFSSSKTLVNKISDDMKTAQKFFEK